MEYVKIEPNTAIPHDPDRPHTKRLLLMTEQYGEFLGWYDGTNFRKDYATVLENVTHFAELPRSPRIGEIEEMSKRFGRLNDLRFDRMTEVGVDSISLIAEGSFNPRMAVRYKNGVTATFDGREKILKEVDRMIEFLESNPKA